jgi:hypothetical protein
VPAYVAYSEDSGYQKTQPHHQTVPGSHYDKAD